MNVLVNVLVLLADRTPLSMHTRLLVLFVLHIRTHAHRHRQTDAHTGTHGHTDKCTHTDI